MKNSLSLTGLFSFLSLLFLSACQKPEQTIGSDLLPADDELSAFQTDTITILCSVEKEDSVRMDELSSALLGSYSDPVFGRTKASLCTQIRLSSSSADFPENFEIDSVVLSLVYANHDYYGTLHPQYFSVYEMSEDLSVDSVYYSNRQPHHTGDNLILPGKEVYEIHPDEKVPVAGDTLIPQLRLRLSTETGQKLLAPSDPSVLNSDANFRTYFKGLYIDPIYWNAAIVNYNLADPGSKLTVYYRDLDNSEPDTTRYDFVITSDCARYSYMSHDYAGTALSGLTTDNPLDGSTSCYIQAGAGIKTRLDFPHLSDFNSLVGRTVNKAELVIPFEPGDRFYPQDKLFLLYKNQQGSLQILPDQTMQTIGGGVNLFHNEYRFNISRYIQKVLNDEISPEAIYLLSSSAGVSVNRVFAHGPLFSSEDKRENMRLIITLTN